MDYYKLLNDYLNRGESVVEYDVINWEDRGSIIEVRYRRLSDEWNSCTTISLFDLLTFVYSKISI